MGCGFFSTSQITFEKKYVIGETIGSGHFAQVHLCYEKSKIKKKYAVKIINKTHLVNFEILDSEVTFIGVLFLFCFFWKN